MILVGDSVWFDDINHGFVMAIEDGKYVIMGDDGRRYRKNRGKVELDDIGGEDIESID